jgi:ribosomal protein S18 acetylase RimI-like enzyme
MTLGNLQIRPFVDDDMQAIVQLSLLAWEPVYRSFEQILGPQIYPLLYPDWREFQKTAVTEICQDSEKVHVLVAELEGAAVGFLAYELDEKKETGEVQLLAVHPDHQERGIGTELNLLALAKMKAAGMVKAVVDTGGDESHAPARRSYEKAGYTALPLVRYYKAL